MTLDPETVTVLTEHWARCQERAASAGVTLTREAFVFSRLPGGRAHLVPSSVTQRYGRLVRRLGIDTHLNNLRHYSATELIAAGADVRTVAGRSRSPTRLARPGSGLARFLAAQEIVAVAVPSVEREAARDLRHGIVYYDGRPWTIRHDHWLRAQRLGQPSTQLAFDAAYDAMIATVGRRDRLDEAITTMAAGSDYAPPVSRLGCLRGVSTLTVDQRPEQIQTLVDLHRPVDQRVSSFPVMQRAHIDSGRARRVPVWAGVVKHRIGCRSTRGHSHPSDCGALRERVFHAGSMRTYRSEHGIRGAARFERQP